MIDFTLTDDLTELKDRIDAFVRDTVIPYEKDPRRGAHGPTDELRVELNGLARDAGLFVPQLPAEWGGMGLDHVGTAIALEAAGYSPLGPVALHCAAPDEGNMNLLAKVASPEQQRKWLAPVAAGEYRSCFAMTEPGGAGADPTLTTTAVPDGDDFVINGRKWFITGAEGAGVTIIMADVPDGHGVTPGATMFLSAVDAPGIKMVRAMDTMDSSFTGGHWEIEFDGLRVPKSEVLGAVGEGFRYVQVRLAPARLTHCMRWLGGARRAHDIAKGYAKERLAFGKPLAEHGAVGAMLADNEIELQQARLMIWWAAHVLDRGEKGRHETSMTKTAVAETLFRIADRCVQILGGLGVAEDTVVAQMFQEIRAFRIYDGPSEVHRWAIARRILKS
ncbi:MAG: acyl-CoA dehydrogenase family protein [Rhodospirillaceae bacterium]